MKIKQIFFLIIAFLFFACEKQQPVLYMIGDSTMADKPDLDYPERGWGQVLPTFFDSTFVIENHAKNGRSTRSFIYEGRWDSVYNKLKSGDFVIIQFGHNDEVETKIGRHATPEEYRYNLKRFVKESIEKGAKPILCTPIARRNFINGVQTDTHGEYPGIVVDVAKEMKVPCIEMNAKSTEYISELGEEGSVASFLHFPPGMYPQSPDGRNDNTHLSKKGALAMAGLFVEGIYEQNVELKQYLNQKQKK
jgi:DNA sulfur modification protein DndE